MWGMGLEWASPTYAIDQVKYNPHSNTELLKVQIPIVVHVREIPDSFKLVIAKLAVFEYGGCLIASEVSTAIGEGGEDLPIAFDFPLFNLLAGHCRVGQDKGNMTLTKPEDGHEVHRT